MQVLLANPRGFCAGVDRAIEIVERALDLFGAPIYVRHEVVHNTYVVECLRSKGAVFIEDLSEVPAGAKLIFSAHGVSQAVRQEAKKRGFKVFDATCPLVTKVHMEVSRFSQTGQECVLIGHQGHPEVEGTMGQFNEQQGGKIYLIETVKDVEQLTVNDPNKLAYFTQTTLSMDDTAEVIKALKQSFPNIQGPKKDDICYATQNRQDAVKELVAACDILFVVGSPNSSNSNRLREVAARLNIPAYLIDDEAEIDQSWLQGKNKIGLTAGASAPEILVERVLQRLKEWGVADSDIIQNQGVKETVVFSLPKELK